MKKADFFYHLPERLIAQTPTQRRDASRLLVLRKNGEREHGVFRDILRHLRQGDCLVLNETRVIPARLLGEKVGTGGAVEVLLLRDLGESRWECAVFPGKRLKAHAKVTFGGGRLRGEVLEVLPDGNRVVGFEFDGVFLEILNETGTMPLPHYIKTRLDDGERYQTVYARERGSAAAPTAGLHFTPELLREIEEMGVSVAKLTLHVGLGTFRPVKAENILEHKMHSESFAISPECAGKINRVKKEGGRIICVGTTSCRALESACGEDGLVRAGAGETDIFIYPGYSFKVADGLITNFHLPESTLVMLVSALAGRENVLAAYAEAVQMEYRFFSFGDAMLIV